MEAWTNFLKSRNCEGFAETPLLLLPACRDYHTDFMTCLLCKSREILDDPDKFQGVDSNVWELAQACSYGLEDLSDKEIDRLDKVRLRDPADGDAGETSGSFSAIQSLESLQVTDANQTASSIINKEIIVSLAASAAAVSPGGTVQWRPDRPPPPSAACRSGNPRCRPLGGCCGCPVRVEACFGRGALSDSGCLGGRSAARSDRGRPAGAEATIGPRAALAAVAATLASCARRRRHGVRRVRAGAARAHSSFSAVRALGVAGPTRWASTGGRPARASFRNAARSPTPARRLPESAPEV